MMRLSVSNIAWPADQAGAALRLLRDAGVEGLEIAPGLLFAGEADPFRPSPQALATAKASVAEAGLTFTSMQALLYGVAGAALFGDAEARAAFDAGLTRAIGLAGQLGLRNLVVGSPKNRIVPPEMPPVAALDLATETFRRLGARAQQEGCVLAIEPNPARYGTNFLTQVEEADAFVRAVDHPAVTLNFDIGALHVNGTFDRLPQALTACGPRISHVHLSEANLAPFPSSPAVGAAVFAALRQAGYDGWVSIEMLADAEDPLGTLARSLAQTRIAMEAA